ncbi:hypothetical protein ACH5RR_029603 [Cinchona calisaya]|uniref:Zinc finger, CCHC-type n=1 Tax=Cinchona calisaya TaxID=153742 RepID=A0ABD2YVF9_9GENT
MEFATLREIATDFVKLEHFDGDNFRKWQNKMHFLLATLNVIYVLNTPKPMENDEETLANTRAKQKWEDDDYICRGHIMITCLKVFLTHTKMFHIQENCGTNKRQGT